MLLRLGTMAAEMRVEPTKSSNTEKRINKQPNRCEATPQQTIFWIREPVGVNKSHAAHFITLLPATMQ